VVLVFVGASLLWQEKPDGSGEAGQTDEKAAGGDGLEGIGDGKMNLR
jgi:hypothetical protein